MKKKTVSNFSVKKKKGTTRPTIAPQSLTGHVREDFLENAASAMFPVQCPLRTVSEEGYMQKKY